MARSPRIADFYYNHFAKFLVLAILLQTVVATGLVVGALTIYEEGSLRDNALIITAGGIFLLAEILVTTFTLRMFGKPLRIMTDAITHVSSQANATPPPNVNDRAAERSGLKALVQTVYALSVASFQGANTPAETADGNVPAALKQIFGLMPTDMIVLDGHGRVSFHHGEAGVARLPDESMRLSLQFDPGDSFEAWLADCRASKLRDTRVWHRVANTTLGSDNRRIFDIIAHYEKNDNADVETILVLVDRTTDYGRDEDDMDFIALAAHELRAPITVIRGYLDVLNEELADTLQGDQKELLARVQVSAERLSGYINNILNVSRYDRAHLKLHLHEETLAGILRDMVDDLTLRATTQYRSLSFQIDKDLPTIAADRSSLSEVITNLVDNAIKYSQDGGAVTVAARVQPGFVELTVTDTGIGMPASVVGNLFHKFYRSHRSRQAVSGTGLGLYISKAIVESHGGKIWATSSEGQGSTFGVQIPIYATVAEKLASGNNGNENIIESSNGWIKNHSMYRG